MQNLAGFLTKIMKKILRMEFFNQNGAPYPTNLGVILVRSVKLFECIKRLHLLHLLWCKFYGYHNRTYWVSQNGNIEQCNIFKRDKCNF